MHAAVNTPPATRTVPLPDEAATLSLGAALAEEARPGDVIALWGELGAGKTVLARGFIQAMLGEVEVTSPTFTLVQIYGEGASEIWHVDLYRIEAEAELAELGLEEAFERAVCLVEWPERLGALLPEDRLDVGLDFVENGGRNALVTPRGDWSRRQE